MTEEVSYQPINFTNSAYAPEEIQSPIEKLVTESTSLVSSSPIRQNRRVFAPINTPFYRRRQTLTILVWWLLPWVCLYISLLCLRSSNSYIFYGMIAYIIWMALFRQFTRRGGLRQQWFRRLAWWKWFAEYFPIQLHKTCDLPPDRSYIFGCHPHGIISLGAFGNFSTEATGFEHKFPGINLRLLTLSSNFRFPFYDLYLSMLGLADSSKESCNYILKQGNGNSLMLVLGGAREALDARPSNEYILTLKSRKGFVKIGLIHGASLVPVFSFGENDLYEQVSNPRGSRIRRWQNYLQKKMGYSLPLFNGRGVFQYAIGFLPNRRPIDTYVGEALDLPKLEQDKITPDIIDHYHKLYMDALTRLFDTYKAKHGQANATIMYADDDAK